LPPNSLSQKIQLAGPDGAPYDIPVGGSIGLLALGDLGTIAWRQKLRSIQEEMGKRTEANLSKSESGDLPNPKDHPQSK